MRVLAAVLFVALVGPAAVAEDATPAARVESRPARPRLPLRVIRTMPDTHQALVLDTERRTYLVVEVGGTVDGFTVADVDDESVTFDAPSGIELVLATPAKDSAPAIQPGKAPSVAVVTPAPAAENLERGKRLGEPPAPIDPYAEPVDPYAGSEIHAVEAPPAPAVVSASAPPAPVADPAPATVTATATAPATGTATAPATVTVAAAPAAAPPPTLSDAPIVLRRAAVESALTNFAQLASSVRATLTPDGVRVDWLAPESLFAHMGLAAHDLIVSVDGRPLRTLDDAATLYARAATTRNVTIQAVRGDKPITLRVAIE